MDDGRTGPDFISPMSSPTKRQSGHLAKLLLQYSRSLSKFELNDTNIGTVCQDGRPSVAVEVPSRDFPSVKARSDGILDQAVHQQVHPQAVIVVDLDEVASNQAVPSEDHRRRLESQYTTPADIDLMVLIPMLLCLLVFLKSGYRLSISAFIAIDFIGALILGPGTLTLIRRTAIRPAELDPGDGCVVLMDDDLTMVIQGSQRIVEAITEGGFYLSFAEPQFYPPVEGQTQVVAPVAEQWQEKQLVSSVLYSFLEGAHHGVGNAMIIRVARSIPMVFVGLIFQAFVLALQMSTTHSLLPAGGATPLRSLPRLTDRSFRLALFVAASLASASSDMILLHGMLFFAQTSCFGLFARLVLQSQNYHIRMDQFLNALGHPPVRKWPFPTQASAVTFLCLVLCQDIPRPVKNIDVLGVLDTLIPNQRDIWRVWKQRVADRIVYEEDGINFAPTLPTFPDDRQERPRLLLDEAQIGYNKYLASKRAEQERVVTFRNIEVHTI